MPDFTTASAISLIMSSLTLHANLFHEFQPMGGVRARFAEGDVFSCAKEPETDSDIKKQASTMKGVFFMRQLYQNAGELGTEMQERAGKPDRLNLWALQLRCRVAISALRVSSSDRETSSGGVRRGDRRGLSRGGLAFWDQSRSRPARRFRASRGRGIECDTSCRCRTFASLQRAGEWVRLVRLLL